mmetsp:Transcript_99727/g.321294  ORF Transcript_99727/g.321294 Transcript_99727/m.321294 type:complete len:208 (-) Transcript_99727:48-671(-)
MFIWPSVPLGKCKKSKSVSPHSYASITCVYFTGMLRTINVVMPGTLDMTSAIIDRESKDLGGVSQECNLSDGYPAEVLKWSSSQPFGGPKQKSSKSDEQMPSAARSESCTGWDGTTAAMGLVMSSFASISEMMSSSLLQLAPNSMTASCSWCWSCGAGISGLARGDAKWPETTSAGHPGLGTARECWKSRVLCMMMLTLSSEIGESG